MEVNLQLRSNERYRILDMKDEISYSQSNLVGVCGWRDQRPLLISLLISVPTWKAVRRAKWWVQGHRAEPGPYLGVLSQVCAFPLKQANSCKIWKERKTYSDEQIRTLRWRWSLGVGRDFLRGPRPHIQQSPLWTDKMLSARVFMHLLFDLHKSYLVASSTLQKEKLRLRVVN